MDQASGEVTYIRPSVRIPVFKSYYNFDYLKHITKVKPHYYDSNRERERNRDHERDQDND